MAEVGFVTFKYQRWMRIGNQRLVHEGYTDWYKVTGAMMSWFPNIMLCKVTITKACISQPKELNIRMRITLT